MSNCPRCGVYTGNGNHCSSCAPYTGNQDTSGCFPAGTRILCNNGLRNIETLNVGDKVKAFDKKKSSLITRKIIKKKEYSPQRILEVVLQNRGKTISTTQTHSFLTNTGWKKAGMLVKGQKIFSLDEDFKIIENLIDDVIKTNQYEPVFNIIVEGEHTFIAEGMITHSYSYFRDFRSWLDNARLYLNTKKIANLSYKY